MLHVNIAAGNTLNRHIPVKATQAAMFTGSAASPLWRINKYKVSGEKKQVAVQSVFLCFILLTNATRYDRADVSQAETAATSPSKKTNVLPSYVPCKYIRNLKLKHN